MRKQLDHMALAGIIVPSLSHYVKYVPTLTRFKLIGLIKH